MRKSREQGNEGTREQEISDLGGCAEWRIVGEGLTSIGVHPPGETVYEPTGSPLGTEAPRQRWSPFWAGSGGAESDEGDFGRAIEAEGKADGADAAVNVKEQIVDAKPALNVLFAERRKDEGTEDGKANLAAMRVAGEHEANGFAGGMAEEIVGPVGRVAKKDYGLTGEIADGFGDGFVGVGNALERIVEAGKPKPGAGAFDGDAGVVEHRNVVGDERLNDLATAELDVVVAENSIAKWTFEAIEYVGAQPLGAMHEFPG